MAKASEDTEEGDICRYCFEGEGGENGELISPCKCSGGQKWVHLSCLRRWQRGILVSQPTHPDFYDDDQRHKVCNVCKAPYTCRPPTRLELMQSFTGAELAALVEERCLIASHPNFSATLRRELSSLPEDLHDEVATRHWVDGAFLIVRVVEDTGSTIVLEVRGKEQLGVFASELSGDWCWKVNNRHYRLLFEGPIADVDTSKVQAVKDAIRAMQIPCSFRLTPSDGGDCAEDNVVAVNLTRPADFTSSAHVNRRLRFEAILRKAFPNGEALLPPVAHLLGGPCENCKPQCTIVAYRDGGYRIYERPIRALREAQELCRAAPPAPAQGGPTTGRSTALESEGDAAGQAPELKRRRTAASGVEAAEPAAAENNTVPASSSTADPMAAEVPHSSRPVARVMVFWGTAGWSRCQLMGEIASGSWGLCRPVDEEVTDMPPANLYEAVRPRLVFAPRSEMSERNDDAPSEEDRRAFFLRVHRRLRRRQQAQEQLARIAAATANLDNTQTAIQLLMGNASPDVQGHGEAATLIGEAEEAARELAVAAGASAIGSSDEDDDLEEILEESDDDSEEGEEEEDGEGEEEEEEDDGNNNQEQSVVEGTSPQ